MEAQASATEFVVQMTALLQSAGLTPTILSSQTCTQGRNNRTYRIQTLDGSFIVKQYLRQPGDTRDRLAAEFAFLSYAQTLAPTCVPKPYCQDVKQGLALYEFIEGQPLQPQDITAAEVAQAADFFCALNQSHRTTSAQDLPVASEACFSIQEHLDLIAQRINHLEKIVPETPEDREAQRLIQRLHAYWQERVAKIHRIAKDEGLHLTAALSLQQRCISPSDFGFHNALKMPDGRIYFLDFEYAGWDDPAKMIGDFFSQLALPIPEELFSDFVKKTLQPFDDGAQLARRAQLLRFVYRVKWCCIALNIFLPVHLARYRFANPALQVADFKRKQLDKVAHLIQALETTPDGLS